MSQPNKFNPTRGRGRGEGSQRGRGRGEGSQHGRGRGCGNNRGRVVGERPWYPVGTFASVDKRYTAEDPHFIPSGGRGTRSGGRGHHTPAQDRLDRMRKMKVAESQTEWSISTENVSTILMTGYWRPAMTVVKTKSSVDSPTHLHLHQLLLLLS